MKSNEMPYGLDGSKRPAALGFWPPDQNLWALALAAEYASATGDPDPFRQELPYHPVHSAEPVSLQQNLRRQLRFFVEGVGLGEHGHVRMLNADWNDTAVSLASVETLSDGRLRVRGGAEFESRTLRIDGDGHGRLHAKGEAVAESLFGEVRGGAGWALW